MVSFTTVFSDKAAEEFKKLRSDLQERIKKKLFEAQENPFHYFERLAARTDYKLRVGDYRLIADIYQNIQRIEITKVGHRKNIYNE